MESLNAKAQATDALKLFIKGETSQSLEEIAKQNLAHLSPSFVEEGGQLDYSSDRALRNSREVLKSKMIHTFLAYVDFPALFQNVATSVLTKKWKDEVGTWRKWVGNISLNNFRFSEINNVGLLPEPRLVRESMEYKLVQLYGEKAAAQLLTYGDIFNIGREVFFNSGQDAFNQIISSISSCFDRLISTQVYTFLNDNPVCFEDRELFHGDHNNQMEKTSDYEKDIENAFKLMYGQKIKIDAGDQQLSIKPKYVLAAPDEAFALSKALVDFNKAVEENQRLELIVEPRINNQAWYLATDKDVSSIRTFTLDGSETPSIQTKEYNQRNGMDVKYRFDFDVSPVDYRGLVRVRGAM